MATLLLEWKEEPVSPLSSEESLVSDDVDLYESILLDEKVDLEFVHCESKAEVATKLLEDLEQLGNLDEYIKGEFDDLIKDEPFSNWLDDGKIFDNVGPVACSAPQLAPLSSTPVLWQEFENVLYTMPQDTLTPPQSPPNFVTLETKPNIFTQREKQVYAVPEQNFLNEVLVFNQPTTIDLQPDVARELAVVDELIRTRAENLIDCPLSPGSNTSSSSNFGDCSSDDPEWIPETVESSSEHELGKKSESRKRSKPYSRVPNVDRKSRKKEQNKNAATRYRMKKKAEVEEVLKEEGILAKENDGLENQISELQREIKYLKSLMREVFKAKGLFN